MRYGLWHDFQVRTGCLQQGRDTAVDLLPTSGKSQTLLAHRLSSNVRGQIRRLCCLDLPIAFAFFSALLGIQGLLYQPVTRDSGQ